MVERLATTPFGGGRMTARLFARQASVAERQEKLRAGDGGNDKGASDKWQLIRALTEARDHFGLSDRAIGLLEALVSFTTDRVLDGANPIIVFPSNRELSLRARGMAPATIRRHLTALVEAGLLFRRDSANGKRFCRRDDNGVVEDAFGFDLAPLALKSSEILSLAEQARAQARNRAPGGGQAHEAGLDGVDILHQPGRGLAPALPRRPLLHRAPAAGRPQRAAGTRRPLRRQLPRLPARPGQPRGLPRLRERDCRTGPDPHRLARAGRAGRAR